MELRDHTYGSLVEPAYPPELLELTDVLVDAEEFKEAEKLLDEYIRRGAVVLTEQANGVALKEMTSLKAMQEIPGQMSLLVR